jgi:hypothetical protein
MRERNEEASTNVTPDSCRPLSRSSPYALAARDSGPRKGFDTLTIEMRGMLLATERAKNRNLGGKTHSRRAEGLRT